jgi:ABC-2 type transport system ATP-binding protein
VSTAIETRELEKRYGRRVALGGLTLTVPTGAVYVLVGPNGAGKTTALRALLDLVRADGGSARVHGLDAVKEGARVRALCGHVPERQDSGYGWMTVEQLLAYHASYRTTWDRAYARELLERLEVRDHTKYGKLSKGEARRVQLVTALAHRPPVLLLDEPTDGLDPVMREQALSLLADHMAESETTLLISTHLVYEVEGLGDHLGVLKDGVLTAELDRETLRRRLRRYRVTSPDASPGDLPVEGDVVRREGRGREQAWTVWGEEADVVGRLQSAGLAVGQVDPLTLEEAAIALLGRRNGAGKLSTDEAREAIASEGGKP